MKDFKDCYSDTGSVKIGEKTYITGKVTIGDIISFQKWCEKEAKKDLVELAEMTGVKPSLKELRSLVIEPELYDQKSASLEGVIYLFLSVVKRLNKDVDDDYIRANITVQDIEKISELISEEVDDEKAEEKDNSANFPQKTKKTKTKSA